MFCSTVKINITLLRYSEICAKNEIKFARIIAISYIVQNVENVFRKDSCEFGPSKGLCSLSLFFWKEDIGYSTNRLKHWPNEDILMGNATERAILFPYCSIQGQQNGKGVCVLLYSIPKCMVQTCAMYIHKGNFSNKFQTVQENYLKKKVLALTMWVVFLYISVISYHKGQASQK